MNAKAIFGWTKKLPRFTGKWPRDDNSRGSTFLLKFTVLFAVIALILCLAAGYAVTRFIGGDIENKTLEDSKNDVSQVTARSIAANLTPEMLQASLSGEELASFDKFVRQSVLSSRTPRISVWNAKGTVVYSSDASLIGSTFPLSEHLQAALAGETQGKVEEPAEEGVEDSGLGSYDKLLEVYTPITFADSSEITGAFEIYRDYSPIAAHVADVQRTVFIGIAAALGALYLTLVLLVRRGSDLIRKQQGDLQAGSQELKNSYDSIVAVLCSALDLRDNVTHGHAQRVSALASIVARQMGLRKEEVRQIEKAAILHDIGKIGVADVVLSKPGPLDEFEWEEMKRHPELGYQIIKDIDFLKDAADVVYAHHERFDGSGYPRGLKGDQIPLGARIFAVIDAYDAMTSDRPYRKALPHRRALREIVRNSISQFDPEVVRAFVEAEKRGLFSDDHQSDEEDEEAFALVEPGGLETISNGAVNDDARIFKSSRSNPSSA